jgi:hypothetical protein
LLLVEAAIHVCRQKERGRSDTVLCFVHTGTEKLIPPVYTCGMRQRFALALAAMILALPVLVSAQSTTDTIARIQELVRQLTVVQQQLKDLLAAQSAQTSQPVSGVALSPPFRVCPAISRVLSRGTRGDDVLELQKFLISQRFLDEENASGFFGSLTEDALRKWQSANGIVSSGDALSTGWRFRSCDARAHSAIVRPK